MPQFSRALDVYQGFNFKKDKQSPVGFITKMVIGGDVVELTADQETILNPEQPDQVMDTKVVGVLNHFLWETGVTDAIYLSGQISTQNKQKLAVALLGNWASIGVVFNYAIFEYDPLKKQYFKSTWSDAELQGVIEKNGEDLNLSIADDPSTEVQSPKNFTFQIGIKPATLEQSVNIATAHQKVIVKKWGITEAVAA